MVLLGVSGQALSPGRQLHAIARYRRSAKRWTLPAGADKHGLVLATAPPPDIDDAEDLDLERGVEGPWDEDSWGRADDRRQVRDEDAEGVLE
jgi:hypothetical protein